MGRQSERAKRRRSRATPSVPDRTATSPSRPSPPPRQRRWYWLVLPIVLIIAVAAIFAGMRARSSSSSPPSSQRATSAPVSQARIINGIPCTQEMLTYHVHAHLTMTDSGKSVVVPANTGIDYKHQCLYWLHTHDASGLIHVEAPHKVRMFLGEFFDIWGQPLSRTTADGITVKPGKSMRIWVNGNLYSGNPRDVELKKHQDITIEVGPPFSTPKSFKFDGE